MENKRTKSINPLQNTSEVSQPYILRMDRLKSLLFENKTLALILVDASHLNRIEKAFGKKVYQDILEKLSQMVSGLRGEVIRKDDIVTSWHPGGAQFLIFLGKKRNEKKFFSSDLEGLRDRINRNLNQKIFNQVFPYLKGRPNIAVGHAIVIDHPLIQEERLIERLVEDSRTMVKFQKFKEEIRNKEKLQELIINEEIQTVFQPILDLKTRHILGYEALSRGPKGTEYENPFNLFDTAREAGLTFELDRICRRKALSIASQLQPNVKVFINCLPTTVYDPEFKGVYLQDFLKDIKRKAINVVMEISGQEAIHYYPVFRKAMPYDSDLDLSVAIDDAGTGYSSLEAIVELQPHYLKLDISMVRGIDRNLLKQEMTKTLVSFANKMNAQIIAEGIESQQELETLLSLGIPFGQGFYLGRPGPLEK